MFEDHLQNGCLLPAAQALITGVLVGVLAMAGCIYWDVEKPGVIALAGGAGGAVLMWLSGYSAWRRVAFEDLFYSPAPPAPPAPDRVKVELTRPLDGGKQTQLADLPASYEQLKALADGVLRGVPLSENTWSGGGRPFTRAEFGALRGELLRRGWCDWRRSDSPGQGCVLTPQGKAVLRSFASETVRPVPPTQDIEAYQ